MISTICPHCGYETRLTTAQRVDMIEELIQVTEIVMDITRDQLISHRRYREWVKARHLVWLVAYEWMGEKGVSLIGRMFYRDHATIIHGIDAYRTAMSIYDEYRERYELALKIWKGSK